MRLGRGGSTILADYGEDKMNNQKNLVNSLVILAIGLIPGCDKPVSEPIKLGINPWPGYEFLYLAQEMGFYEELGVPVKIIEYGSLSDVRRGYERGNLDAMATTLIEVLQVKNNSARDPQVILVADFSYGGDVIIARKPLKTPIDLKGKRIGADTTSLPIFVLARSLELSGLTLADVEVVPLEQSDMEKEYLAGNIDAAVTYPPVSVRLQDRDDSSIIFSSKEIPGEIVDVVSVEKSVWEKRPEDVKKIQLAWDKALSFAKDNPKQAHEIMAKREGISPQEFAEALSDLKTVNLAEQEKYYSGLKRILSNIKDVLVQTGVLSPQTSADCCLQGTI